MRKQQVRELITSVGVVPVVRAASASSAMMAMEAVCRGGIPIVEITMTVPGAVELIREAARTLGSDVLVGAGTISDVETARRCVDAGAEFLVTPGLDVPTVEFARNAGVVVMAGALTPSEVMVASKTGADFVKIFPCGALGGARYIRALRGPFPDIPMVPTGGVRLDTAGDFICAGAAALGVGGELISAEALNSNNLESITANAARFVEIVRTARERAPQTKSAIASH